MTSFKTSYLVDNVDNFIAIFLQKKQDIKLLIFKINDVQTFKNSGVIGFKSRIINYSFMH